MTDRPRDFGEKLRATARLLGCRTRKEICARFRAQDPRTVFEPDRLAKWINGVATPREGRAYDEIARLLGLDRPGSWVAAAPLDAFLAAAEAAQSSGAASAAAGRAEAQASYDLGHLHAQYHCLSPAWSPYYTGELVRGRLRLAPGRDSRLEATYEEALLDSRLVFAGPVAISVRNLHMALREAETGFCVSLTTCLPGHPASVLCGLLAGVAVLGPEVAPSCGRLVALRLPAGAGAGPTGYAPCLAGTVCDDLRAFGLEPPAELGAAVVAFLGAGSGTVARVDWSDQAGLAQLADPLHLAAGRQRMPA